MLQTERTTGETLQSGIECASVAHDTAVEVETYVLTFREDGTPERLSGERRRTRRRDNAATLHADTQRQDRTRQTESLQRQRDSTTRNSGSAGTGKAKRCGWWQWLLAGSVAGVALTLFLIRKIKKH